MPRSHEAGIARYNPQGPTSVGVAAAERLGDKIDSILLRNTHESPHQLKQLQLGERYSRAVEGRIANAGTAVARAASDTNGSDTGP